MFINGVWVIFEYFVRLLYVYVVFFILFIYVFILYYGKEIFENICICFWSIKKGK